MRTVISSEAQRRFGALLAIVAAGESVTITRRGLPVGRLISPESHADEMVARARALRAGSRLDGLTIRQLIDEGRR